MRALGSAGRLLTRVVVAVIFGLLVLSFALWGGGDLVRGRVSAGAVAEVGGREIQRGALFRAWNNQPAPAGGRRGRREAEAALETLIDSELVALESEALRLRVGREDLEGALGDFPPLQSASGEYDPARLAPLLRGIGFSEREFAERFSQDVLAQRLQGSLLSGVRAPEALARMLVERDSHRRRARWIRVPSAPQADEAGADAAADAGEAAAADGAEAEAADDPFAPTDAELEEFYEEVKDNYASHERRTVSWLWLDPSVLEEGIEPSDEEVAERYEADLDTRYTVHGERSFRQEVFDDEEEARARHAELAERAAALAAEAEAAAAAAAEAEADGGDEAEAEAADDAPALPDIRIVGPDGEPIEGITIGSPSVESEPPAPEIIEGARLFGPLPASEMPPETAEALFAEGQGVGLVPEPVASPFGWRILEVVSATEGSVTTLEEAREGIADELRREAALDRAAEEANLLDDALGRGLTLEQAAAEVGARVETTTFNAFGLDADDGQVEGLASDEDARREVFAAPESEVGRPSLLLEARGLGGYYARRIDAVEPREPRPLEGELRGQVRERLIAERRREAAEERAEALAERARAGEALDDIAASEGLAVEEGEPMSRSERWPFSAFAAALFSTDGGDRVRVAPVEDDFAVLVLEEVLPDGAGGAEGAAAADEGADGSGDGEEGGPPREAVLSEAGRLQGEIANEIYGQYIDALRERHEVRINPEQVDLLVEGVEHGFGASYGGGGRRGQ